MVLSTSLLILHHINEYDSDVTAVYFKKKYRALLCIYLYDAHCKTQYRKFETSIPRKGNARPHSQFPHSCVCEGFIYMYTHDRSAYSAAGKHVGQYWEYINRSPAHKCGNWDWGLAIPFLRIHKWDLCCSVGVTFVTSTVPNCPQPSLKTTHRMIDGWLNSWFIHNLYS